MDSQAMNNPLDHPAPAPQNATAQIPPSALVMGTAARFALLHHTGIPHPHYDLLLEVPGHERLMTWRIFPHPDTWHASPPLAERIHDHRHLYLTYEGAISQDRGHVARLDHGTALVVDLPLTPPTLTLRLPNALLHLPL